jgi:hypothetical protein
MLVKWIVTLPAVVDNETASNFSCPLGSAFSAKALARGTGGAVGAGAVAGLLLVAGGAAGAEACVVLVGLAAGVLAAVALAAGLGGRCCLVLTLARLDFLLCLALLAAGVGRVADALAPGDPLDAEGEVPAAELLLELDPPHPARTSSKRNVRAVAGLLMMLSP